MRYLSIAAVRLGVGHNQITKKPKFKHVIASVVRDSSGQADN
jgi:hypothetical protein